MPAMSIADKIHGRAWRWSSSAIGLICSVFVATVAPADASEYKVEWTRQLGTFSDDRHESVAVDPLGDVYVSGYSSGSLVRDTNGSYEAYLAKYDPIGGLQWMRPAMTDLGGRQLDLTVDGSGNIFAVGATQGPLNCATDPPSEVRVARYDSTGAMQWVRSVGLTSNGSSNVSADQSGNVFVAGGYYIAGETFSDEFAASVSRLDASGNVRWSQKARGTVGGVAGDGLGNVFVAGNTGYRSGLPNSLLSKYDAEGELLWTREWGTDKVDICCGVATDDSGNAYVAGYSGIGTSGPQPSDETNDIFLSKFSPWGDIQWTRWLASDSSDVSNSIFVRGNRIYLSGMTQGRLDGEAAGSFDAFVAAFDTSGEFEWMHQFGTEGWDSAADIAVDGRGNLYLAGLTQGSLGAPNLGDQFDFDALVIRMTPVPEPSSQALLLGILIGGLTFSRRRLRTTRRHIR